MSVNKKKSLKTKEELILASEHLHYEINMFNETICLLIKNGNKQTAISNILIESITMRIRILLHFLYPEDKRSGDILAEHFFEDPIDWLTLRGEMPVELQDVKFRVGKEIVHLTYERLNKSVEEKKWNFNKLFFAISKPINVFLEHVPKEKLDSNYFNNGKLI